MQQSGTSSVVSLTEARPPASIGYSRARGAGCAGPVSTVVGGRSLFAALEEYLIPLLESLYRSMGYLGVFLAMSIESACIPLPSEIVLPLAGWMVAKGEFDL